MAKQPVRMPDLSSNPLARTSQSTPQDNSDLSKGNMRPLGVGLSQGERDALDQIAAEYGVARNALLRFAVRNFIIQYRAGEIDLASQLQAPPPPKKKLQMPE